VEELHGEALGFERTFWKKPGESGQEDQKAVFGEKEFGK
jgi:hypothetical protein